MSVQRTKGTRLERTVAVYLAAALNDDRIERRALNGAKDRVVELERIIKRLRADIARVVES